MILLIDLWNTVQHKIKFMIQGMNFEFSSQKFIFTRFFFKLGGFSKVKLTRMENTDLDFLIEDHLTKLCLDGPKLSLLAEQD